MLPTSLIDAHGIRTELAYDERGRLLSRTEAANTSLARTTTWTYSAQFRAFPETISRLSTSGSGERVTSFVYDPFTGDLLERRESGAEATWPGGAFDLATLQTYNAAGQPATIDPPGHGGDDVTTYLYPLPGDDPRGGLFASARVDPLVGATSFAYDPFNRRVSETDPNGVTTVTRYDDPEGRGTLDRVYQVIREGAVPAEDLVTEHAYTPFGDLHRTILPRGNVIEYGYDAAGRLTSVERKPDPATQAE